MIIPYQFQYIFNYIIDCLLRLIYQSNEPSPVIILEDACANGYTVIDKPPKNFEVSKMIVQRLAKFHAANFFLISEHVRRLKFSIAWKWFQFTIVENRFKRL